MQGLGESPNAYTYFIVQAAVWEKVCDVIGEPDWKDAEGFATPPNVSTSLTRFSNALSNGP